MTEFKAFSAKQRRVLTWWTPKSPDKDCDAVICDGAVRSGKSLCSFISFILWSMSSFNGSSFAICGKTVSSVKRNIITPMLPILSELGFKSNYSPSRSELSLSLGPHENKYWLFGGRDESSAALIQGITLSGVMFDEVVLMPRSFVEQALARCSVSGSKFWFNCNPGNPSHWFYTDWIKKHKEKNALYLHFTMGENPSLTKKMLKRYERLYTGVFYERFVLGKWVAAEGLVYPMFDDSVKGKPDGECESFFISCDYGTVNPSSFGLWGFKDGVWYRLSEYYYDSKVQGEQKTDEEHYEALRKLAGGRKINAVICDPSAASFITLIKRKGEFRAMKADNDVLDGIRRVSDAIKTGKIRISPSCRDIIREFSLYRWDDSKGTDTVKKENDHAMDDMRYFVSTVLYSRKNYPIAAAVRRSV